MYRFLLTFSIVLLFVSEVLAQWSNNTAVNTSICDTTGDQATPKIASTSDGGCYIMWFDNRLPNYKVYLQRLDAAGNKKFGTQGLLVSSNTQNSSLQDFNIDVDPSGNAVLVFTDVRSGIINPYAYLVSPDGTLLWGPNGVALTDSVNVSQNIPVVAATSDGNYVFSWVYGSGPNRIAMQKLNAVGLPQWGAPRKLRGTGAENFNYPRLVRSDNGSVIMNWDAYTGNVATTATIKIFVQKFAADSTRQWTLPQDTVQNLGRVAGISFQPTPVSDGNNGVLIYWVDDRDINSRQSIWAQRINSAGVIQFPKNGSEGSLLSTNNHFSPTATYLSATGETVMFWTETNGGQTIVGGLYGQKFDATGNRQWGANGIEFKALDNNQLSFLSVYSIDTSVVVSYTEAIFGSGNGLVKASRIGSSSAFHWPGNIITASSILSSKIRKQSAMDKTSGQTVMTWSDNRSGQGDIYAQNLKFDGGAGACLLDVNIGIEGFWNGTTQVQDTMRVNLRQSVSPYSLVEESKVYLSNSGNAVSGYAAAAGNYYVQLIHRNALETWSAAPINITKASVTGYDFTTSQSQVYGSNSVLKLTRYCSYSGDVNHDATIDVGDVVLVYNDGSNFVSGYVDTDVNGDNFVDVSDLLITYNNATNFVTVARP